MDVNIVIFPETKVASITHLGSPTFEHDTAKKLIAWKLENRYFDSIKNRHYGVHYTNPNTTPDHQHRVDFCLSVENDVGLNQYGIINKIIPSSRCAFARDIGSRFNNKAAVYLYQKWLPKSGESLGNFPMFFHYVNVGPNIRQEEMITDVYLPLN